MNPDPARHPPGGARPRWRSLFVGLLLLCAIAHGVFAQTIEEKKKTPLSPATEQVFAEFADEVRPAKEKQLVQDMEQLIQRIDAKISLTQAERLRLTQAAQALAASASKTWEQRLIEGLRPNYASVAPQFIKRYLSNAEPPLGFPIEGFTLPQNDPSWEKALTSILGPERSALWRPTAEAEKQAVSKEISEYLQNWSVQARLPFEQALKDDIEEMKTELKLPDATLHSLEDASLAELKRVVLQQIERGSRILRSLNEEHRKSMMNGSFRIVFDAPPTIDEDLPWAASVSKIISPAEVAAWKTYKENQQRNNLADWTKTLAPLADAAKENINASLEVDMHRIKTSVAISPEKISALTQAAHTVANDFAAEWIERAIKTLQRTPPQVRASFLQASAPFPAGVPGESAPATIPAWTNAVKGILSPEELQRWHAAEAEIDAQEVRSIAEVFIVEMDRRIAFSASQRKALAPLAEKIAAKQTAGSNPMDAGVGDLNVTQWATLAPPQDLAAILSPAQQLAWHRIVDETQGRRNGQNQVPLWTLPPQPSPDGYRTAEPESVPDVVSQYLYHLLTQQRTHGIEKLQPIVDQIIRVTSLPKEESERLQIAAQGAVEASLGQWLPLMHDNLDVVTRDATPQTIRTKLESLGNWNFNSPDQAPEHQPIWQKTLETILSGERKELWEKERKEQEDYRFHALARLAVITFRHQAPGITQAMADQLENRLIRVLTDYAPELDNFFSPPWYLSSYARTLPLAGLHEDELSAILGPEILQQVKETALSQAFSYWTSVQQNHESRLRTQRNR